MLMSHSTVARQYYKYLGSYGTFGPVCWSDIESNFKKSCFYTCCDIFSYDIKLNIDILNVCKVKKTKFLQNFSVFKKKQISSKTLSLLEHFMIYA